MTDWLKAKYDKQCDFCGCAEFVDDHAKGDMICKGCGMVAEAHMVDEGSEWRTFSDKGGDGADPNRVGGPENPLFEGSGLSTMIGKNTKGDDGNMMSTLSRMHNRNTGSKDRQMTTASTEIGKICDTLSLPGIIKQRALETFKDVVTHNAKQLRGKGTTATYGACTFIACRLENNPRSYKEICAAANDLTKKELGRVVKQILDLLKQNNKNTDMVLNQVSHPVQFLRRFMSQLHMENEDMRAATAFAEKLCEEDPSNEKLKPWEGKAPLSLAATTIFVISLLPRAQKLKITVERVGEITGVAPATIWATYATFYPHLADLIPKNYAGKEELARMPPPDRNPMH
eukprot:TRINITY_DN3403_c0_g1_i4.p1 TRINITY_DN3403_c0_g1~~TRINITY_DN3403_c0_g1_i4.p1  ORF type:complete len:343 (+),score=52.46 TRINITY_DN3403_c0_g1_i4:131-1159(+)